MTTICLLAIAAARGLLLGHARTAPGRRSLTHLLLLHLLQIEQNHFGVRQDQDLGFLRVEVHFTDDTASLQEVVDAA